MKSVWYFIQKIYRAETSCRKWCIFTVSVSVAVVAGAALLAFTVDPFYRYREPFFYDMVYYKLYATAPPILKYQHYDLLMLGTSMTRNFFLDDIDSAFDCKSVKLAASGGTMADICKFFDIARQSKGEKLKRVVWSLDIYSLNKDYDHYSEYDYLYRNDHREDYRYLFSRDTFSSMIYLLKRKLRPFKKRAHQADRNRMFSTDYKGKPYGLQEIIKDAVHNERTHHSQTPYSPEAHRKNFYGRLLPVLDSNPHIRFTVYLPPYHIFTYCQSEHFGEADALIRQRTEVLLELLKRPNVELHDFQSDPAYVENDAVFSDVQHFSNEAACRVLDDLKSKRRQLTGREAVMANEAELRQLIRKNMPRYTRQVSQYKRH